MEKTVIAYYTGTGNTLALAKRFEGVKLVDIIKINEKIWASGFLAKKSLKSSKIIFHINELKKF